MMETAVDTSNTQLAEVFYKAKQLTRMERLTLAKLLLDSILSSEPDEASDWMALGLAAFEKEWDNPEDAIYDNWREHYDVSAG